MARKTNTRLLDAGDIFPGLELTLTDGKRLRLPADLTHPFNVVLVNRGAWCPFCTAQLKSFQAGLSKLTQEGIGVVSFSTDTREKASAVVAENQIEFAVGYGANAVYSSGAIGRLVWQDVVGLVQYIKSHS
jgi:peroxiredoxin